MFHRVVQRRLLFTKCLKSYVMMQKKSLFSEGYNYYPGMKNLQTIYVIYIHIDWKIFCIFFFPLHIYSCVYSFGWSTWMSRFFAHIVVLIFGEFSKYDCQTTYHPRRCSWNLVCRGHTKFHENWWSPFRDSDCILIKYSNKSFINYLSQRIVNNTLIFPLVFCFF